MRGKANNWVTPFNLILFWVGNLEDSGKYQKPQQLSKTTASKKSLQKITEISIRMAFQYLLNDQNVTLLKLPRIQNIDNLMPKGHDLNLFTIISQMDELLTSSPEIKEVFRDFLDENYAVFYKQSNTGWSWTDVLLGCFTFRLTHDEH